MYLNALVRTAALLPTAASPDARAVRFAKVHRARSLARHSRSHSRAKRCISQLLPPVGAFQRDARFLTRAYKTQHTQRLYCRNTRRRQRTTRTSASSAFSTHRMRCIFRIRSLLLMGHSLRFPLLFEATLSLAAWPRSSANLQEFIERFCTH